MVGGCDGEELWRYGCERGFVVRGCCTEGVIL